MVAKSVEVVRLQDLDAEKHGDYWLSPSSNNKVYAFLNAETFIEAYKKLHTKIDKQRIDNIITITIAMKKKLNNLGYLLRSGDQNQDIIGKISTPSYLVNWLEYLLATEPKSSTIFKYALNNKLSTLGNTLVIIVNNESDHTEEEKYKQDTLLNFIEHPDKLYSKYNIIAQHDNLITAYRSAVRILAKYYRRANDILNSSSGNELMLRIVDDAIQKLNISNKMLNYSTVGVGKTYDLTIDTKGFLNLESMPIDAIQELLEDKITFTVHSNVDNYTSKLVLLGYREIQEVSKYGITIKQLFNGENIQIVSNNPIIDMINNKIVQKIN